MKTQLLQDFDESGSKAAAEAARAAQPQPAEQPYAAPPAAVWHRRQAPVTQRSAPPAQSVQRAEPSMMGGATGATTQGQPSAGQMRPPGGQDQAQAAQSRQRAPEGAWTGPRPLPPDARMAATDAHVRAQVHPQAPAQEQVRTRPQAAAPPPIQPAAAPDIPDWLSERLREDAEQEAQRQRSRVMARRALSWSAAATVVAMLAVAGYWFYQESRVEGALNVVANTSPAPAASMAPVKPVVPASSPVTAAPAADRNASPVAPEPVANAAPPPPVAAPGTPELTQAGTAQPETAQDNIEHPAPHRKRRAKPVTRPQATADTGPTPAQRREETLMQCRVLGYDARECTRRGCMMTRFGLACPG
jgi:hypothetical protein